MFPLSYESTLGHILHLMKLKNSTLYTTILANDFIETRYFDIKFTMNIWMNYLKSLRITDKYFSETETLFLFHRLPHLVR